MKILTLLALLVPILSGAALLIVRPQNRAKRNRYVMLTVCVSAVFVLGTALASALNGPDAVYLHVADLSDKLVIAFRPDGVSLVFGCIIGILWPVTTVYAFSYMEHEGRENMFFGFFLITFGVVAGIAYSANFFTLYLCYEFMTLVTLPLVMHEMDGKARAAGKKYVLYSMTGAALVFICLMYFLRYADTLAFTYGGILNMDKVKGHEKELMTVFVLGFFGFGVKAAIFPFHRWLPAASVAPTPVTALLHAVAVVKCDAPCVLRLRLCVSARHLGAVCGAGGVGFHGDVRFGDVAENAAPQAAACLLHGLQPELYSGGFRLHEPGRACGRTAAHGVPRGY